MSHKNLLTTLSIALISLSISACNNDSDHSNTVVETKKQPNILFIMADDLGYSDLGAFGGEIHTPNIDALTKEGRILTDYHTAPTCSPTRSQLISGTDHHLAGIGAMAELTPAHLKGQPGYEGYLNERSLSIAEVLKDNGYRTYISGKWHLGLTAETNAHVKGFDHSFTLLQGLDLHFKQAPSAYKRNATYTEDGKVVPISALPDDFFSTNYFTDKLISYLESGKNSGKPFFAYAAYTAPHWPLQAPAEYRDRYRGVYDAGYDAIRNGRIARQKQLGLIPANFTAAEPIATKNAPQKYGKWNELSTEQKVLEARRMEIYAGMVENLDANIGRVIEYLKRNNLYDNTLIFFVSDNGAEGFIRGSYGAESGFDNRVNNVGTSSSYHYVGPRWAEVSAAPFHLWKDTAGEGATTAPAIVKLPHQNKAQATYHGFASVLDVFPTVLDYANIAVPQSQYKGRQINTPSGYSWKSVLENKAQAIRPVNFSFADELHGSKYARQGEWKIALQGKAELGTGAWELYNLKNDRGETQNLAQNNPVKLQELLDVYNKYTQQNGVKEYNIQ
ncbi:MULTISPECIES: arylsulfatase [Acinetobacter]|uniref:arylsulfatase n=1 Tax=Acinetobacter TaxID=469 RepID=UPI00141AE81B|nr:MULTISPECIES: arylsulfatase [Acinetobacter]MCS4299018.1 arylsulfatase [Acinetobacter guillouiae]MCW2250335.1 arylsulfatase [Acinetobacter sp. BIGb0204]NII37568.1 arylsulfatase [Acinetobacter sp. BIGb0196]